MATCYICLTSFPSVRGLIMHFKVKHQFNVSSLYKCAQGACCRSYNDVDSFKKHLKKHDCINVVPERKSCHSNEEEGEPECAMQDVEIANRMEVQPDDLSPEDFKSMVHTQAEVLVAKLYSKPGLPRNHVQSIMDDTSSYLSSGFLEVVKDKVLRNMQSSGAEVSAINDIEMMFDVMLNPFESLSTEYRRLKKFRESGDYIPPVQYVVGKEQRDVRSSGGVRVQYVDVCAQFIPLRRVLKKFLELPNALADIMSFVDSLKACSYSIRNFVQCPLWQEKIRNFQDSDIVFPLFVYFDDFEPNNPLGPHSSKLGAVYVAIACLPLECQSLVENIFLAMLFDTYDRDDYSNKKMFAPLIEELKFLETSGISVLTETGEKHVYFMTGLIWGDNLGVNTIMGFAEGFKANYFCRFCKSRNCGTGSFVQVVEDRSLLRDKDNYTDDLVVNNVSCTGVHEECVFNSIPSFHVTSNYAVDPMHDLLEGIAHNIMHFIIKHFIYKQKYFSLDDLNYRIQMFDYGPIDIKNKPPCISLTCLTDSKKLKMTAYETHCFVKYFGCILGSEVPKGDKHWQMYLALLKIQNVVTAKFLPASISPMLSVLIKELNELYIELIGNLPPKSHLLIHYPRVLDNSGPLTNLSTDRFESKHKPLKLSATVNMSRINIAHSIAVKNQLNLCYRFKANRGIKPEMIVGPGDLVLKILMCEGSDEFKNTLPPELQTSFCPNWVNYKGTQFSGNMVLITSIDDYLLPQFGEIAMIFIHGCTPVFVCTSLTTVGMNQHTNAFQVTRQDTEWYCVTPSDLVDPLPVSVHRVSDGKLYVVLKYIL